MSAGNATPDTVGLEEAARILQISPSHLRRRTRAGIVPGAKFGRRWVYVRTDLIELVREQAKARAPRAIVIRAAVPVSRSALVDSLRALRAATKRKSGIPPPVVRDDLGPGARGRR